MMLIKERGMTPGRCKIKLTVIRGQDWDDLISDLLLYRIIFDSHNEYSCRMVFEDCLLF